MTAIKISNEIKIPVYVQIANQFKEAIETEELKEGDSLPGRQVLARQLGVNINTINHAYRILENDGFIYSRRGIGSFVNPKIGHKAKGELREEIREKLRVLKRKALARGWMMEEFRSLIQEFLKMEMEAIIPKAVFVECHTAWTSNLALRLQNELGIEVTPVVIPERKTNLKEVMQAIKEADIIITTHIHFDEVREMVDSGKLVFPLDMHLSYELMTELAGIKEGKIAVPFLKPAAIKRLNHWIKAVGFKIDLIPIQHKDIKDLSMKTKDFKTFMVTENDLEKLREFLPNDVKILTIKSILGEQSIQHLKENLLKTYPLQILPIPQKEATK